MTQIPCDDCDGKGYVAHGVVKLSGEGGEPYQEPCEACGALGYMTTPDPLRAVLDEMPDDLWNTESGHRIEPRRCAELMPIDASCDCGQRRYQRLVHALRAALAVDTAPHQPSDHIFIHRQFEVVCAVAGCEHPPLAAASRPEDDDPDCLCDPNFSHMKVDHTDYDYT